MLTVNITIGNDVLHNDIVTAGKNVAYKGLKRQVR